MIRIRDLLAYYGDEGLDFNQIAALYNEGQLQLEAGTVSQDDQRTIEQECDLEPLDITRLELMNSLTTRNCRKSNDAPPLETLIEEAKKLEDTSKELHRKLRMTRGQKKTGSSERETANQTFDTYVQLARTCEIIYASNGQSPYHARAIECRIAARQVLNPTNINEKRKYADNLLMIGEANLVEGANHPCRELLEARQIYAELLDNIRNDESRSKAEENAKIGVVSLLLYMNSKRKTHLDEAVKILQAYREHDKNDDYASRTFQALTLQREQDD
ncbi:hypothetical protein KY363_00035 [Candidatus Woesearchaeota archaeon]|nr:hypothetical protein [Candidatus Woesearchaeota archaeon]